jgi:hypothetical protein
VIVVYIAGPYTAPDAWQRERNIREAELLAMHLASNPNFPVAVICVHTMSRFAFGHVPEGRAIAADDELLARSDAVVLCPGWARSTGTKNEIRLAYQLGMPVFEDHVLFYNWAFPPEERVGEERLVNSLVPQGDGFTHQRIEPLVGA